MRYAEHPVYVQYSLLLDDLEEYTNSASSERSRITTAESAERDH